VAVAVRKTRASVPSPVARWLPVVLWALVISVLSTDTFSGEHTGAVLLPILRTILPGASPETLLGVHAAIRKLAHLTEYAILGMLVLRALERPGRSLATACAVALLLCASYASLDEFHQTFVPSRTASPVDVAIRRSTSPFAQSSSRWLRRSSA
jgi:VanZ family protein